jgi:DNA topoisomerase-1
VFDTVAIDLRPAGDSGAAPASDSLFRATGSILVKPGYRLAYQEGRPGKIDESDRILPPLAEDQVLTLVDILPEQHFTEPPPRYSEASLVRTLEEHGIGRPSTYAAIISTLQNREYVEMDRRRFIPTDIGRIVNRFLTQHFDTYVVYDFTARLEDELDAISRGEEDWLPLMERFWQPFVDRVNEKETSVTRAEAVQARDLGTDPESGKPMTVRMGRFGPFIQIGTREDEEKPRFAGLRPGQKMDAITREEALALFELPRALGETEDGEEVSANIGRYGPYVRYGKKFVSLKEDDPYTIGLERALELIREKKIADANRVIQVFEEEGIQVLNGRYGPYITDGNKNAKVPKDREPKSLTLEECQAAIAAAPERRGRKKKAATKKSAAKKTTTRKTAAKKKTSKKKAAAKKKASSKKKTASKKKAAVSKKSGTGATRKTTASKSSGTSAGAATDAASGVASDAGGS